MRRPRLLDLFCGAGGAAMGYHQAGFDVVGVDIEPQPNYPFTFYRDDASRWTAPTLKMFDVVHASPPCQAFTAYQRRPDHVRLRPDLIPEVRFNLVDAGVPFVIENVRGSTLRSPFQLCGSSFGLDVRRHRWFESSVEVLAPPCDHSWQLPRFPNSTNRTNLRSTVEVGVWRIPLSVQRAAMGIQWMTLEELSQAIPPVYTRWIGEQLLAAQSSRFGVPV